MKGFVKVTKKDANTGEELYESDWIENIIYDANFATYQPFATLYKNLGGSASGNVVPQTLDPYVAYNRQSHTANGGVGHYLFASDYYDPSPSSTIRSQPGKFWQFQKIQGTPFVVVEGNGQTTIPTIKFTQQLLPPPTGSRNIHSIGWNGGLPGRSYGTGSYHRNRPHARTAAFFTPAITQSTTEIVVVAYKVQYTFPVSSTTLSYDQMSSLFWVLSGIPEAQGQSLSYYTSSYVTGNLRLNGYDYNVAYSPFKFPPPSRRPNTTYAAGKPNVGGLYAPSWSNLQSTSSFRGQKWDGTVFITSSRVETTDTNAGDIISTVRPRGPSALNVCWYTPAISPSTNKTQQYYGKLSGATVPFFSAEEIPNTDARITLDTAPYSTTVFPELWSIDIGGVTGGVGTAEYSLRKRYVTGWVNNTLVPREQTFAYLKQDEKLSFSDWGDYVFDLSASDAPVLSYRNITDDFGAYAVPGSPLKLYRLNQKSLHFYNLETGENRAINSLQYPAFTATTIGGHSYDELSDTLWVTCQSTGLWKLVSPFSISPTISNLDLSSISDVAATVTNNAYVVSLGLAVGGTHRTVWAMMNGALAKSTDNGATWIGFDSTSTGGVTFTQATIEGKWSSVLSMVADKNSDNKLLVLYETNPNSLFVNINNNNGYYAEVNGIWWDNISDTTQLMADSGAIPFWYGGVATSAATTRRYGIGYSSPASINSRASIDATIIPYFRRYWVNIIGCTRTQSHWYIAHLNTNQNNYLSGTYRNVPVLLTHGTQIGPAGAGFTELLSGDTYTDDYSDNTIPRYSYPGNENSLNHTDPQGGANYSFWLGHTEHIDDEGNDCLVQPKYLGFITSFNKFTFGTTRIDILSTSSDRSVSNISNTTQYIGKGLILSIYEDNMKIVALSDGTIEGVSAASKMAGNVWDRYVWTGSIWRLRTGDADPLTLKSTHGTTDALIGGATISFDDAGSTQSFVSGEAISAHVIDGIMVDTATEATLYNPNISMWDNEIVTEVTNSTVASSTPSELLPVTYYDNAFINGIGTVFTNESYLTWGTPLTFEDVHSTVTFYPKTGSGGVPVNNSYKASTWGMAEEYPEFRSWLSYSTTGTLSGTNIWHLASRLSSSDATTGNLNLEVQLLNPQGGKIAGNNATLIRDFGLQDSRSESSPTTGGYKVETAFGLVNASNYTEGASPAQGMEEPSEILYGFKIVPSNLYSSGLTNFPISTYNWMGSPGYEANQFYTYNDSSSNISDMLNEASHSAIMTIQVIESGSVVFTQPSGDRYNSVVKLIEMSSTTNRAFVDLSTTDSVLNPSLEAQQIGYRDPINDRFCPFNIERVGTTIKYYLRDKLIYTSLATSTENLMPGVITMFECDNRGSGSGRDPASGFGHMHGLIFKKPQTDFFVKVGTSGSSNGAFNSNFLFLQTAVRQGFSIKIDGVEATVTGLEDNGTLNAGEVSVFPRQGLIRCSSADAGKTVTVSIPCAYRS